MRPAGIPSQFRVLYRVFLLRVIDLELLSADGDTAKMLGQIAAVFAGISFLFITPLLLLGGNLPEPFLWTAEHLLIATTITVVGLFSVLSWDSLIPDRRDVLILAPLPIRTITLFASKLVSMVVALSLVIVSLNIFTGVGWPLFFAPAAGAMSSLRSLAAYWATVMLAGAFTFCLVLTIQGAAMQLFPRQIYLRLSALLQVAAFCLFVGLYFLEPSLETRQALTAPENRTLLGWLPAYWFLGLFQQLNGTMAAGFASLADRAWMGIAIAGFAAICMMLAAYFRTLPKLVEQPDLLPSSRRVAWWPRTLDATQTAILLFAVRTLLRSRQHRLIASFYVGAAAVLAYMRLSLGDVAILHGLRAAQSRGIVLSTTIMLMCIAVATMRVIFSMPISLRANWIFRIAELLETPQYVAAVRRTLFLMSVVPVLLILSIALFFIWRPALAVEHLLALTLFGGCLLELSLLGFQKVPFTCSYLPGKANVHIAFWVSVMLLIPIANGAAHLEGRLLDSPRVAFF